MHDSSTVNILEKNLLQNLSLVKHFQRSKLARHGKESPCGFLLYPCGALWDWLSLSSYGIYLDGDAHINLVRTIFTLPEKPHLSV